MARFILQQCKLRDYSFVPTSDDPLTLTWPELKGKLSPTGSHRSLLNLRRGRIGHYLGLIKDKTSGKPINFLLVNSGHPYQIKLTLKNDPTISERLIEIYRIVLAEWDDSCVELPEQ